MPKEKLDLLKLAAGVMAETRTRAAGMPHAAFPELCRIPDYAEPLAKSLVGGNERCLRLAEIRHNNAN